MKPTQSMKHLLFCLVPWMVMTAAAAQETPRQVQVVYTNVGPADGWRVGDECYVAPGVLTSWHWPFSQVDNEITIQAEGRTVRVPTKIIRDRVLIPVKAVFDQLGGSCKWRSQEELDVLGQIRMVTVKDGALQIDGTLRARPHIFSLSDPNRLVVDIRGMTLASRVEGELPDNIHVSQYSPDTVRVVLQSDDVPMSIKGKDDATRHIELRINFPHRSNRPTGHPDLVRPNGDNDEQPVRGSTQNEQAAPPRQSPNEFVVVNESPRSATFSLSFDAQLKDAPQMRRIDPYTFEVYLPGIQLDRNLQKPVAALVESVQTSTTSDGSVLRVRTTQAIGAEFTTSNKGIVIMLRRPSTPGSLRGRVVVVDPGHGGTDSGARSPDHAVNEKDLTLSIAQQVAEELTAQGATVIMTRSDDTFIPLKERPAIANRNGADFFVSIHINSNTVNNSRSGTTTYFHGQDSSSKLLADCIENEIVQVSGIPRLGVLSDTSRYKSGFAVLRYCRMPSILIETGFINSSVDRTRMCSPSFQVNVARAIVRGLKVYLGDARQEETN